ncbi:MAG: cellulase family glycosylhydrolase [Acholeplasmataceae bacterium]|nr:cellulase family glycosylhydrolase [Acholeplasmataceae bacterium]
MSEIRGVNLGGWFVLESWIKPALFENIKSKDETGFSLLNPNAEKDLKEHWDTFIVKEDFIYLKSIGINSVRLPIPWWLQGESPYFSCLTYLHRAMQWATEVGLDVLLDLHTAPGCQNGFDNGGIQDVMTWHLDLKNIQITVDKLEYIADTFKDYPSFWGLQVLNEPFLTIDMDIIIDFYLRSYRAIRKHTNKTIVFHDSFRSDHDVWKPFFTNPELKNVMFDLHLYHCFDPKLATCTFDVHIDLILNKRLQIIKDISKFVDVIIGEWSLGIKYDTMKLDPTISHKQYDKMLADLQLYIYSFAKGYYFWNYKIENDRLGWNFKKLIEEGIMPDHYE